MNNVRITKRLMNEKCHETNSGKKSKKVLIPNEHIARVRAEREAAREAKRENMLVQGVDPDYPPQLQFIKRPILPLHEGEDINGFKFRIMSYNCLAQTLIRRELFPTSGSALKWHRRSKVLLNEIKHYNADVICLQEIDFVQFENFWQAKLANWGYESQFHRKGSKNHGIAIVWRREYFTMTDKVLIDFDNEPSGNIEPRTITNNVGLIVSLAFSDKLVRRYHLRKKGIIAGTAHLFWHPFGTFERTRQCYVLLHKVKEFSHRVGILQDDSDHDASHWYAFFCGDFNSQPFDSPYLSMTCKPIKYSDKVKNMIERSACYSFSKERRSSEVEEGKGENANVEKLDTAQPVPTFSNNYEGDAHVHKLIQQMQDLHNLLNVRAISLYSVAYNKVHPENSGFDNERGEPEISNWAHTWHGLLDYIFFIKPWDFSPCKEVDSLELFEQENNLRIRGFLRMPSGNEMTKHGQPHTGEFPSDHLCMLCEIEVLN